jgi:hypothetical protein
MKKNPYPFLLLLVLLSFTLISPIIAQESPQIYSEVRVYISDQTDLIELQKAGLALDHIQYHGSYFDAVLSIRQIEKLNTLNRQYDILVEDLSEYYQKNIRVDAGEMKALQKKMKEHYNISGFEFGSMGGYYTFDVISQFG